MATAQPMLKGDFHMHTYYSKDCGTDPRDLVKQAVKVGLSCIAVTDHNSIKGALEIQQIAPPTLRVIVAEEIKTTFGEITGFFLKEEIPKGLSPKETCERIKAQGGLVSLPHPYDRFRRSVIESDALAGIMDYIDMVEVFNARTPFLKDSNKALQFADQHGFLKGAGSDAHTPGELGHVFIEMPMFQTVDEFKAALRQANIQGRRSSPIYHVITTWTKVRKKYLSRRRA